MEFDTYLRFILVLIFVLGLVLARLGIVETAFLGPKHRLILVRRDDVEHLVLLGPNSNTVVESGILGDGKTRQSFKAMVKAETAPAPLKEESGS
jgi:flagellar protein FliO/FliZ